MANIPVYDEQHVLPAPVQAPNVNIDVRRPLAPDAEALNRAGEAIDKLVRKESDEADVTAVAGAETKLKQAIDANIYDPQTGLRATQGSATLDRAGAAYDGITKAQQQIGNGLTPRQQEIFNRRAGGMVEDAHRTGEEYVGQQIRVIKQANLQAGQQMSLGIIARDPADDTTIARQTASMEAPLRALSPSKEAGDAAVLKWRGDVAQTVINARLTKGDTDGAVAYFSRPDVQEALGDNVGRYQHTIGGLVAQKQGVTQATSIIQGAKQDVTGWVDESKVQAELEKIPAGPTRNVVEEEARRQLTLARQAETQQKAGLFDQALSSYYTSGKNPLAPSRVMMTNGLSVAGMLELYDPEGWHKFQSVVHEDQVHAKAGAQQTTTDQLAAFTFVINDMAAHPDQYRDMDEKEFLRTNLPDMGQKFFKQAAEKLATIKAERPKDLALTGDAETAVTEASQAAFMEPKNSPKDWSPEHLKAWEDVHDYVQTQAARWAADHNGKKPELSQYNAWATERLVKRRVPDTGFFSDDEVTRAEFETNPKYKGKQFGSSAERAQDAKASPGSDAVPKQAQSPKALKGYRWNKARTQRKPVFSDGSEGPAETVNGG